MGLRDLLNDDNDRRDFRDFADRFDRGRPEEHYDEHEARDRYSRIERHLDDDEYERSARETFSRMEPRQRRELSRELRSRGRQRGYDFGRDDDDRDDPSVLAGMLRGARQQDAGGLGGLLGGGDGGDGLLGGTMGKVLMGGIAAMAVRQVVKDR